FNWAGLAAPSPGEANITLVFPNSAVPKTMTNDIAGLSAASLLFEGPNYIVHGKPNGNALALAGSGLGGWAVVASANNCQLASSCPIVLSNSGAIGVASGTTLTINSTMSGPGGFTKSSAGTLKLHGSAANSYAGNTAVSDGTIELNNNGNAIPGAL